MDGTFLGLFLFATFIGGMASGISGFALGVVVSSIWLHIIPPAQTAVLIVGCGLVTQGYAIWKLRRSLDWRKVAPFIAGGAIGVPIGTALLTYVVPAHMRIGVGVLLLAFSTYSLMRPAFKPVHVGLPADVGIGVLNGVLGGMTGLTGIIVTIWCQLRGWPRDVQRTVFQPVNLAAIAMSVVSFGVAGTVTAETAKLYVIGLPLLLAGLWGGFKLYGKLDDGTFRKVMLVFLVLSGLTLVLPRLNF